MDLEASGSLDEAKASGRMDVLGGQDETKRFLETFYLPVPTWPMGVASTSASNLTAADPSSTTPPVVVPLSDPQLLALHRLLTIVDPAEAGRWHWRDGRKVRRGIERWWERQWQQQREHQRLGQQSAGKKPKSEEGDEERMTSDEGSGADSSQPAPAPARRRER